MNATPSVLGGPTLPQERRLVTDVPGPRSREWMTRKEASVPRGIGTTMPVFAAAAGGGVVVDVDGNSLIDLGSGIAVTTVGNSAIRVTEAVQRQAELFTHTCFMVTPYDSYVRVAEQLNRLTPGDHEKRTVLFNSGPRPSRTRSRSAAPTRAARRSSPSTTPTTDVRRSRWG